MAFDEEPDHAAGEETSREIVQEIQERFAVLLARLDERLGRRGAAEDGSATGN